ncbi:MULTISPECIES: IclR family transcriptional regulator [Isoptericola]|uniref:IclR family transcriptional regulator n=1 Tax=Isoptericola haloaureus TaxID=1542902 RepID=A0ABU7Z4G8_9MICO|nr:IclR family transcriptional regulator [Isoptericola sp. AK164]
MPEDHRSSTTHRVAQVLLAFTGQQRWLGVTELARRLGLGKAVVHRILQALVETGLVRYDENRRLYALGPTAVALGRGADAGNELLTAARPVIAHLSHATGETTTVTQRTGHTRTYVGQVESAQHIRIAITLGEHQPLTNGASGLSILAFLPEEDVDLVLQVPLPQFTPRTVTDPDAIRERLAEIRERGWAYTASERVPHSSSVAAPIHDVTGAAVGSLSVAYLDSRFDEREVPRLADLVVEAAESATQRLVAAQRG